MKANNIKLLIASVLLAILVTAVYWNHFDNAFHFDDSHAIQSNAAIKDLSLWKTYFTDAATHSSLPTNQGYRPLLTLSFAIDYWLGGNELHPVNYHITSFFWFMLQAVMMFFLFRDILDKVSSDKLNPWVSLFAVGFYCLHTVNAETVNYISARSDILSTVAVVGGMLIFVGTKGWKRHLALLPVATGILVKQTAVMYLPIMLAYVALFELKLDIKGMLHPKQWPALLKWAVPAGVICFGFFLLTHKLTPETWVPGGDSAFRYAITQPFVILRYFWLFFVPVGLSADSDWEPLESMADVRFLVGMLFLLALVITIFRTAMKETQRPVAFGLLWFILALLPTSSFVPLSEVTNDHRMFFPYVGLVLALTWPVAQWFLQRAAEFPTDAPSIRSAALLTVALLYGGHAFGVINRNETWGTEESLWLDVTKKSPNNGRGLMNYGLSQMREGNYDVAMEYYNRALNTNYRNHPYLFVNMATAQSALGNDSEAERLYRVAVEKGWNYPDCHYFYARWLFDHKRASEAEYYAKEALRLSPGHQFAQGLLSVMGATVGSQLEQAKQLVIDAPTPENYLNLSLHYYRNNQFHECIVACKSALELRPDYADAWNNICSAQNAMGQWKLGIEACEKALAIRPDYQLAKNNLSWAKMELAKQGQ